MAQTFRIKKSVKEWIDVTEILKIRQNKPELIPLDGLDDKEKAEAIEANNKATSEQMKENISAVLDKMLDENAEKTLEVLALCCFVEPEHVDDYPMSEYLKNITELFNDESVMSFFTSLAQLGMKSTANVSKI